MATKMVAAKMGQIPLLRFGAYGAAGQGKTTLLAGFHKDPRTGPSLWLNCGGNPGMLLKRDDVSFILNMDKHTDIDDPIGFLMAGQPERHPFRTKWEIPPDLMFRSLVIDTFTDWQGLLIDHVLGIKSDDLAHVDVARSVTYADPMKHGKPIGGQTLLQARKILLALPVHVFLGLQEFDDVHFDGEEDVEGKLKVTRGYKEQQIDLWGKSRMRVPTWLNLMGRLYWTKGKLIDVEVTPGRFVKRPDFYPVIQWVDDRSHVKNQVSDNLGQLLERPTAEKILNLIEAE